MSLLEDVFLADEANEAQELERIIEGDEYDARPRSDSDENSEKEDEAEEDKRRVDPTTTKTRRVVKHPRFTLNPARLTGPRGIQLIPEHFKDFKFKGKGYEKEDLDLMLKKLEHWAYRLYPKFQFEDCLKKIETLGKKRPVMVHLQKIRTDQFLSEETVVQKDSSDEEPQPEDEFDKLLQQQIELARSTPAPGSVKKVFDSHISGKRPVMMPKATSSPSISEEQRERMLRNKKLAEERRLARLKNLTNSTQSENQIQNKQNTDNAIAEIHDKVETEVAIKRNRSNVIESSDEDDVIINKSITADVHNEINNSSNSKSKSLNINDNNEHESAKESNEVELEIDDNVCENDNSDNLDKRLNINDKNGNKSTTNEIQMVTDDNVHQNDISDNTENDSEINKENQHKRIKESNGMVSDDNILQNDKSDNIFNTDDKEPDQINESENSHAEKEDIHNNDIIIADSNNHESHNLNNIMEGNNAIIIEKEIIVNSNSKKVVQENIENLDDLMDVDFSDDF